MLPVEQNFASAQALNGSDARLVIELVAGIQPTAQVLERYGLTMDDLKVKLKDSGFRAMYRECRREWGADKNIRKRIKYKAGMLLEDGLQDVFMILKDTQIPAQHRIEAFKQLGSVAGANTPEKGDAQENGFGVTIIIGETPDKRVQINARPPVIEHESA